MRAPPPMRFLAPFRRWWAPLSLACATALMLASGCGSSDETTATTPLPPPTLVITALQTTAGQWVPGNEPDLPLGCDPDGVVGVQLGPNASQGSVEQKSRLLNFTLRGPGGCGSAPSCGHVLLTVIGPSGDQKQFSSASAFVEVPLANFPFAEGDYTFHAELHTDADAAVKNDGGLVVAEATLTVLGPTGCSMDAASDVLADAGADVSADGADVSTDGAGPDTATTDAFDAGVDARDAGAEAGSLSDATDAFGAASEGG